MIANATDVKSCLERVLALMAERDKINEGIADVIEEFKPKGVLGKGIRRVATLRRMDPSKRRSDEQLYTDYEDALGSLPEAVELVRAGKTYDEAAEATGLSRATVARMVKAAREVSNGRENETPAHDPATGEVITETQDAAPQGESFPEATQTVEIAPPPVTPVPDGGVGAGTHSETAGLDTSPGDSEGTAENEAASAPAVANAESCGGGENRRPAAPVGSREASDRKAWSGEPGGPSGTMNQITEPGLASGPQDLDLTIPAFLRRVA